MFQISNQTCCKCQNCGEYTNHANDPHFKALVKQRDELAAKLERIVSKYYGMMEHGVDLRHGTHAKIFAQVVAETPAASLAAIKAEAWESGFNAGYDYCAGDTPGQPRNPHKENSDG